AFGPIPKPARTLQPTYTLDPPQDGERSVTLRRVGGSPMIYMAHHMGAGSHPDFAAAELLASILGDAPAGRLHKRLVEPQLAASSFGFAWSLAEPAPMFLGLQLAPGQDVDKARAALLATLDGLRDEPITAEELERARAAWLKGWELGFTDPEAIGVQISNAIARGDWRLYFLQRDQVRRLTLADVQRVANERLVRDNRTVGMYLPTDKPQRAPAPARVDVAAQVKDYKGDAAAAQAEAFDATPANLDARTQTFTLASGMRVGLIPKGTRGRVVQARLRLHYGDEGSLLGEETVAAFVGGLLDKGGGGLTRQQVSDEFDRLRAQVSFAAHEQTLTATLTTPREHLPALITLVGRLVQQPAFAPAALEETRRQWLARIETQRKEPDGVITNALQRHGNPYPRGHLRYASTFDEAVQDVNAVTVERLRAFHARFYSAAVSEFAAVGDVDAPAVKRALESAFASWRAPAGGAIPYVRVPEPLLAPKPERFVLLTPDKQNANLRTALQLPISDDHPDYPALLLANRMFGQGTASRLWVRVRERGGLSYDVRSVIDWNDEAPNSLWSVSAIFAPGNRAQVETAVQEEIARTRDGGFTPAELDENRLGLLGLRRLARAQDGQVAAQLAGNLHLTRTFALSQRVDAAIERLTLADVNAAFRKYADPARWSIAWGGDFKGP
ncbi:MAG TPA: insulinase family protein, partial [Burkholderiaceae bacterium]|nr:insulinase family protein [Burkholderiaceae bacterium]